MCGAVACCRIFTEAEAPRRLILDRRRELRKFRNPGDVRRIANNQDSTFETGGSDSGEKVRSSLDSLGTADQARVCVSGVCSPVGDGLGSMLASSSSSAATAPGRPFSTLR